jgi:hypothetical protein
VKLLRLGASAAILIALVVLSFQTSCTRAAAVPAVPCTTASLGEGFHGQFHLASIQNYGCEAQWAFVWATVGTGEQAIGVTEVLNYEATSSRWAIVSRATYCKATILPSVVYRQGCFSN